MRSRLLAVLAGPLLASAACNALSGVGDLAIDPAGPAGSVRDGSRSGEGALEGGGDGGGNDGPQDIPVVMPSLAMCGADQVCIPNTSGWTPAVYVVFSASGACPANWPTQKSYQMSGGGSCDCECTPSAGACAGPIVMRSGATCADPPTTFGVAIDRTCSNEAAPLPAPVSLTNTGSPPTGCTGAVDPQLGAPQQAVTCTGAMTTTSSSCGSGEVCVPRPAKGMFGVPGGVVCMAHDGDVKCPESLPLRIVGGTSVADHRSCGTSCSCAPTGNCNGGTVDAFMDAMCTGAGIRKLNVDGTCNPGPATTATAFRYTPGDYCTVKQAPQVLGSEIVAAPRTFCCAEPFGG